MILAGCLLAGCNGSPTEPTFPELGPQDGLLEGIIGGSAFRGTGMFGGTRDVRMGWGGNFQFSSDGRGESGGESIFGIWHDGVIPPPGSYDVSFPSPFQRGFWLFYSRTSRQGPIVFAAYTGAIEIESSSSTEVRGSFHVRARPSCEVRTCPGPGEVPETGTIELSGSIRLGALNRVFVPI